VALPLSDTHGKIKTVKNELSRWGVMVENGQKRTNIAKNKNG